ncbi:MULTISPECIES: DUF1302 domain-containing protein [unclassified Pseudomonas]|uniref:DUF1302 domain-containing protein n=1 Tax=unclassified Pseudomonas TaxID=196821 RepID=UPI00244831EF|nr:MULTISPECIES: DUF1302 domain-containing protein [unclassified Pseudomonas]MDG9926991.1 DUF1302 domain-containing protein [Pseudomonas sp. GD04042]MDH0485902.1 DUF1302 domain-containing protein [Pseudomonas sp. GD04015]MDH0602406.1 DUF1302 domain-containing protein [Pseudomonas sp. GD03869]
MRTMKPLALAICAATSTPGLAVTFQLGELEGQFDSALSVGASWSTQSAKSEFIGANNGGGAASVLGDDGRLNFAKGETFSKIFKGLHDLELRYGDSGAFFRGKYWYDFELKDESRPWKDISDSNRKEGAKSAGAQLLDAFVYHNYELAGQQGSARLGRQVISWGESTFIGGGINSVNPVDVAAFRRPGAEIKEGLIPVSLFSLSQSLTEDLSVEAFYQLDWEQTVVDNCGTFFGVDNVADGCDQNIVGPDISGNALARAALEPFGVQLTREGIVIPRVSDNDARDSGQWGAALRWFSAPLDAEFGAYFMNYHSRTPYFSVVAGPNIADLAFTDTVCANLGIPAAACGGIVASPTGQSLVSAYRLGTSRYYFDYPEDIRLYGLSFATTLATGTALSGEFSYRPNAPLQLNGADLVTGLLGSPALSPVNAAVRPGNDERVAGYRRKEVSQLQVTATHFFDRVMGAERLTLVGEAALVRVGGLEGDGGLRYGRDAIYGTGALADNGLCRTSTNTTRPEECNDKGFTTSTSWGYRVRAIWDYRNVFAGVSLRPNLAWSHDVEGYGPTTTPFNEGAKALSVGLDAEYDKTYGASLSYTNFFGGDYNTQVDRDFIALSFGVNF